MPGHPVNFCQSISALFNPQGYDCWTFGGVGGWHLSGTKLEDFGICNEVMVGSVHSCVFGKGLVQLKIIIFCENVFFFSDVVCSLHENK